MKMGIFQCCSSSKQHDLLQSNPALRSYCFCRKQLGVKDGVIFYAWLFDSPKRLPISAQAQAREGAVQLS